MEWDVNATTRYLVSDWFSELSAATRTPLWYVQLTGDSILRIISYTPKYIKHDLSTYLLCESTTWNIPTYLVNNFSYNWLNQLLNFKTVNFYSSFQKLPFTLTGAQEESIKTNSPSLESSHNLHFAPKYTKAIFTIPETRKIHLCFN